MSLDSHPLIGKSDWIFFQPNLGIKSRYLARDIEPRKGKVTETLRSIDCGSTCREGLISNVRQAFQKLTVEKQQIGDRKWEVGLVQKQEIVLDDDKVLGAGDSQIWIDARWLRTEDYTHGPPAANRKIVLEEFLKVADVVAGIPAALLNPTRRPGDWWRTDAETAVRNGNVYWNGSDNVFLQHPAMMAVLTGLYRQAYLLCYAGYGPQVLESGPYEEVVDAITAGEWKPIFGLAEKFRPWINVPAPTGGFAYNFAFPWHVPKPKRVSYWQRFVRLQRALRRHGFNEVLGQDICSGWGLLDKSTEYTGAYSFWGQEKKLTEHHKRVMELGRPLKRKKRDAEETQAAS